MHDIEPTRDLIEDVEGVVERNAVALKAIVKGLTVERSTAFLYHPYQPLVAVCWRCDREN